MEQVEQEDPKRFVKGKGRFVDDLQLEGMLHLHMVRSPYARAKILKVDGGINGFEMKAQVESAGEGAMGGGGNVVFPALATEIVQYAGQPVAAVLGKDEAEAEDMAEEVEVEYEPLEPVIEPVAALKAEPIHPGTTSNVFNTFELGASFSVDAPVVVEDELVNERIIPNPLETRGLVADYREGMLTVYASTQSVYSWRGGLASSLNLNPEAVRVIQMDTGGAFGSKSAVYPEYVVAAYASMKTGKPVKWIESRYEHLRATNQGRGVRAKMKIHSDRSGRVLGLEADILADAGAFPMGIAEFMPLFIGIQATGPYTIEKAHVVGRSVCTNKVPLGPYRGAGRPEAAFFIERMIDLLADELRMDPVDVRMANASSVPFTSPLGLSVDAFRPFLESAVRELRYRERMRRQRHVGFSSFVLMPAVQGGESARVAARGGRVKVWLGGSQTGQGHGFFARQLVREELGVKEDLVDLMPGDTSQLAEGVGTWGSRTSILAGSAIVEAARKLREEVQRMHGKYSPELLLSSEVSAESFYDTDQPLTSFGANIAVAGVRDNIAWPTLIAAYYDVGRPLSPPMIESQVIGGSIQGLGQVLYERAPYDENGQLLVAGITEAGVPSIRDVPLVRVKLAKSESSLPHGAKGVGESPTIGVPPAVVRALELFVGKRLRRTPLEREEITVEGRYHRRMD